MNIFRSVVIKDRLESGRDAVPMGTIIHGFGKHVCPKLVLAKAFSYSKAVFPSLILLPQLNNKMIFSDVNFYPIFFGERGYKDAICMKADKFVGI